MANEANNQQETSLVWKVLKGIVIFMLVRSVLNYFLQNTEKYTKSTVQLDNMDNGHNKMKVKNLWQNGQNFEFEIEVVQKSTENILLAKGGGKYKPGNSPKFQKTVNLDKCLDDETKSLVVKTTLYRKGYSKNVNDENYDEALIVKNFEMVKFRKTIDENEKNLIFGEENLNRKNKSNKSPFLYPKLNIQVVYDNSIYNSMRIPDIIRGILNFYNGFYLPVVSRDNFWILNEDLNPIKKQNNELAITLETVPNYKFLLKTNFERSFEMQKSTFGEMEKEMEGIKRALRDTNPLFLALTFSVSLLHMVFEFLAFKNEIAFWKNKNDLHGLSVRTMFIELFSSLVIALYLFENETSWMVTAGSFFSVVLYTWKLKKAFNFKINPNGGFLGWIKITVKKSEYRSKTHESSDEHDKVAVRYLCYALMPLVFLYSIYSLFYEEHKGWYQWLINSLVGSVYTFGFIMMCPQLYINYKLKSVAHLPWRMMTYKALNTVVDDFFAFVIKMPFLHRIACFRDDLVFAVFLYQKWKYRVDYTRTNEFGYTPLNENNKDNIDNNNNKDIDNNNNKEIDNNNNKEIDNKIESKKIAKPKVE